MGGGYSGYDLTGAAIQTLGHIGPAAKPALPVLKKIVESAGGTYAPLAAETIVLISGEQPPSP
ncbi:MAG TPA: hypothetical protein VFQ26_01185, partial [Nitrospiraceae bacterium]|nr:hypothetical protein [Nitrospiraceae bacterium]